MTNITLAELRLVLDVKEKALSESLRKRSEVETNVYKKIGESKELVHEEHELSVKEVEEKIEKLEKEIRKIRLTLTKYNIETIVNFVLDNEKLTLQEAIYLVQQYRTKLGKMKAMGEFKVTSRIVDPNPRSINQQNFVDRSYEEVTEATYDVKLYREKAKKIETLITKLEVAINQANYGTTVQIDLDLEN